MAHEITRTDNVLLHRTGAWHGLGIKVEDAPTPREGLKLAGLEWGVRQYPLLARINNEQVVVDTHQLNVRMDTGEILGVVSSSYQPVQNADMADFCEALGLVDGSTVRCETIGSIRGGKRVWFLLKGEAFDVANGDQMFPYVCVSNGHDGGATFRVTPTTVRVVCSNTLHAVIPKADTGELYGSAISIRHTVNVMERIEEAKKALAQYTVAIEATRKLANDLADKPVDTAKMQAFFYQLYQEDFKEIPDNPQTKWEQRRRDKAVDAYSSFCRRFDDERSIAGASWWNAANAYSGLVQHDRKTRGSDDVNRVEKRVHDNLFGLNQDRTLKALALACQMAG